MKPRSMLLLTLIIGIGGATYLFFLHSMWLVPGSGVGAIKEGNETRGVSYGSVYDGELGLKFNLPKDWYYDHYYSPTVNIPFNPEGGMNIDLRKNSDCGNYGGILPFILKYYFPRLEVSSYKQLLKLQGQNEDVVETMLSRTTLKDFSILERTKSVDSEFDLEESVTISWKMGPFGVKIKSELRVILNDGVVVSILLSDIEEKLDTSVLDQIQDSIQFTKVEVNGSMHSTVEEPPPNTLRISTKICGSKSEVRRKRPWEIIEGEISLGKRDALYQPFLYIHHESASAER